LIPQTVKAVDVINVTELRQEITDINNGQVDNVINLTAPLFTVMEEDPVEQNANAFPHITSEMTIQKDSNIEGNVRILRDSADDFRFFEINNGGNLTLSGVTLDNGSINDFGGAIQVQNNSDLTLEEVTIINCAAARNGGALDIFLSRATINNSNIGKTGLGNMTERDGGGIYIESDPEQSMVTINDTIIAGNIADNGGGIYNKTTSTSTLTINNSTIEDNNANRVGGGILNSHGNLIINNSRIQNNQASIEGGGIFNDHNLTIIGSTIGPGNLAGGGGGGGLLNNTDKNMTLRNTTVSKNISQGVGGGIENFGNLTMNNVTIGFNETGINGGGLFNSGNDVNLTNTLIGQNMAVNDGDDCHSNVTITTDNSNLIENQANFCMLDGPAITGLSPQLASLALNDNLNNTLTNAIPMMSPAFNAGNNDTCEAVDQRQVSRPQFDICDIGAFELEGDDPDIEPGDANADGFVDTFDIPIVIEKFLNPNFSVPGNGDCNMDGFVDTFDIPCIINIFLNP